MNKKILTAVIGVVIVAVLGGLVYYFQGGNLQGFMKFDPNAKRKQLIGAQITCMNVDMSQYHNILFSAYSSDRGGYYQDFNSLLQGVQNGTVPCGKIVFEAQSFDVSPGTLSTGEKSTVYCDKLTKDDPNNRYLYCNYSAALGNNANFYVSGMIQETGDSFIGLTVNRIVSTNDVGYRSSQQYGQGEIRIF